MPLRQLSAASIFSHYLDTSGSHLHHPFEEFGAREKEQNRRKCCKCCTTEKWCLCCRKKRRKFSDGSDFSGPKDASKDGDGGTDDESEDEGKPPGCCWRLCCFRRHVRRSRIVDEEEEWQEDLGKVQNVTSGFKDWLNHTYRKDKKDPAQVRKERMRVRRSWNKSVAATRANRDRGSVISIKGLNDSKLGIINKMLVDICHWDFDSFELDDRTDRHSLSFITREVFKAQDFMRKFRIKSSALKNLLKALEAGYTMHGNAYHNQRHGADVTQTVYSILNTRPDLHNMFTDLEIFALIFAAIIHDLAHPGTTNNFHVNAQTHLALLYNDRSVLENHHVSSAFQILKNQSCNILENLKTDEFKEFRELVIELVLATDMILHFQHLKTVRAFLRVGEWDGTSHKAIATTLSLILHAADISNPAKPWAIHKRCTDAVMEEYQAQGVQEKSLKIPVSPLCDPKDQTAATQITFIEVIVQPTFQALADLLDMIIAFGPSESKNRPVERRRLTVAESSGRLLSIPENAKNARGSIFANIPLFRGARSSKQQDENDLLLRPWISNLASNIAEWRRIRDLEVVPIQRKLTEKTQKSTETIKKKASFKLNQVSPAELTLESKSQAKSIIEMLQKKK